MSFLDVPSGKIAAVITSLEMLQRPAPRPEVSNSTLVLHHVVRPDLTWYRNLFRQVGENWIWSSRLAMPEAQLAAIIHDPLVEIYVLKAGGAEVGLLELDFRVGTEHLARRHAKQQRIADLSGRAGHGDLDSFPHASSKSDGVLPGELALIEGEPTLRR